MCVWTRKLLVVNFELKSNECVFELHAQFVWYIKVCQILPVMKQHILGNTFVKFPLGFAQQWRRWFVALKNFSPFLWRRVYLEILLYTEIYSSLNKFVDFLKLCFLHFAGIVFHFKVHENPFLKSISSLLAILCLTWRDKTMRNRIFSIEIFQHFKIHIFICQTMEEQNRFQQNWLNVEL